MVPMCGYADTIKGITKRQTHSNKTTQCRSVRMSSDILVCDCISGLPYNVRIVKCGTVYLVHIDRELFVAMATISYLTTYV